MGVKKGKKREVILGFVVLTVILLVGTLTYFAPDRLDNSLDQEITGAAVTGTLSNGELSDQSWISSIVTNVLDDIANVLTGAAVGGAEINSGTVEVPGVPDLIVNDSYSYESDGEEISDEIVEEEIVEENIIAEGNDVEESNPAEEPILSDGAISSLGFDSGGELEVQGGSNGICGGTTSCICGNWLNESRTFDGSDNLANCGMNSIGLYINTSGITLDCANYPIRSTFQTETAIILDSVEDVIIQNCDIGGFDLGLNISGGDTISFESNNLSLNKKIGIYTEGDYHNVTILNSNIHSNGDDGVVFSNFGAFGIKVENNTLYNHSGKNLVYTGQGGGVENNIIYDNGGDGLLIDTDSNSSEILNNVIYDNVGAGIKARNSDSVLFVGNNLTNDPLSMDTMTNCVMIDGKIDGQILALKGSTENLEINNLYISNPGGGALDDETGDSLWNHLIYNTSSGQIKINSTNLTVSEKLIIGDPFIIEENNLGVEINSNNLNLNVSSELTFYNLNYNQTPDLLKDGSRCDDTDYCNVTYDGASDALAAEVSGFSNYTSVAGKNEPCTTLTSDVILNDDIETDVDCFIVGASGITIDGNGHTIENSGGATSAVSMTNFENVTVKNFANIINFSVGIGFYENVFGNSDNGQVLNNSFTSYIGSGNVYCVKGYSDNLIVANNTFTFGDTGNPVLIWNGQESFITENLFNLTDEVSSTAILIGGSGDGSRDAIVSDNLIFANTTNTVVSFNAGSDNVTFRNNLVNITRGGSYGVIFGDDYGVAENNVIEGFDLTSFCLSFSGIGGYTVSNNSVLCNSDSIDIGSVSDSDFINNNLITLSGENIGDNSGVGRFNELIFNNSFGKINWNLSDLSYSQNLTVGENIFLMNNIVGFASIDGSQTLNNTATIEFYQLNYAQTPYLLKDGVRCDDTDYCNVSYDSGVGILQANVSSFSNYSTVAANFVPTHSTPILNSSLGTNFTSENLTAWNVSTSDMDADPIKNIYNWKLNGSSYAILNMPFEGISGTNSDNTYDYSNGPYNAIEHNGVLWNQTRGYDGKGAYQFDGVDDYIEINGLNILGELSNAFTLAAWVKHDNYAGGWSWVFGNVNGGANYFEFGKASGNGELRIHIQDLAPNPFVLDTDGVNVADGNWHHIAATYNGSDVFLYFDGVLNVTDTSGGPIPFDYGNLLLGNNPINEYWDGTIDEVLVLNRTLSSEQISAIYNNQTNLLVSQETSVGDTWSVEITPNDGKENGITRESNNLVVEESPNNPPTHSTPLLNSSLGTNYTIENLTAWNVSTNDLDDDSIKNIYNWLLNGSPITLINMPFEKEGGTDFANAFDYSSLGNNGLELGGVLWKATAGYDSNGAYEFDGEDDYIDLGNITYLPSGNDDRTICFWVKPAQEENNGFVSFFSYGSDVTGKAIEIGIFGDTLRVTGDDVGDFDVGGFFNGKIGTWSHICLAVGQTSASLYANGVDVIPSGAYSWDVDLNQTYLGRSINGSRYFNGSLDEFSFWNRTLSFDQIVALNSSQYNILVREETLIGENWSVEVSPNDGYENGMAKESNSLLVLDDQGSSGDCVNLVQSYNFVSDVYSNGTCFVIETSDIWVNMNGFSLIGNGSGSGFFIGNVTNVTIKNGNISNFNDTIFAFNVTELNLSNLEILNATDKGFYFINVNDSVIEGNSLQEMPLGFKALISYGNLIYNNIFNATLQNVVDNGLNDYNVSYSCSDTHTSIVGRNCTGGNYWNDYTGRDNGVNSAPYDIANDSIGDTLIPYINNYLISQPGHGDFLPLLFCSESWTCNSWGPCLVGGVQHRNCVDANACATILARPAVTQSCTYSSGGGGGTSGTTESNNLVDPNVGSDQVVNRPDNFRPIRPPKISPVPVDPIRVDGPINAPLPPKDQIQTVDEVKENLVIGKIENGLTKPADNINSGSSNNPSSTGGNNNNNNNNNNNGGVNNGVNDILAGNGESNKKTAAVVDSVSDAIRQVAAKQQIEKKILTTEMTNNGVKPLVLVPIAKVGTQEDIKPVIKSKIYSGSAGDNSGFKVSPKTVSDDLIQASLLGANYIVLQGGETAQIDLEVYPGINTKRSVEVTVEMFASNGDETSEEPVSTQTVVVENNNIQTLSSVVPNEDNSIDVFALVAKKENTESAITSSNGALGLYEGQYLEVSLLDGSVSNRPNLGGKFDLIKSVLGLESNQVLFTDVYGPYDVDGNLMENSDQQGFVFAQKFSYDPNLLTSGNYFVNVHVYDEDGSISDQSFYLDLDPTKDIQESVTQTLQAAQTLDLTGAGVTGAAIGQVTGAVTFSEVASVAYEQTEEAAYIIYEDVIPTRESKIAFAFLLILIGICLLVFIFGPARGSLVDVYDGTIEGVQSIGKDLNA